VLVVVKVTVVVGENKQTKQTNFLPLSFFCSYFFLTIDKNFGREKEFGSAF
jgi:hypothetical protein